MPSSNELFTQAAEAYRQGNLREAERCCREVLRAEPKWAEAWNLLGALYRRASRWEEAKRCFREALKVEPENAAFLNNLGEAHRLAGELEKAQKYFREAIQNSPEYIRAYNNLGITLQSEGRFEEAEAKLRQAIDLNPQYAAARNNLGNALYAQERSEDATPHYREAIALQPNYARAYNGLGLALQHMGEKEEAVAHFRKTIEIEPRYAKGHYNLAGVYRELERGEAALAALEEALRIDPEYTSALIRKGALLLDAKKPEEALEVQRRAVEIDPENADAHLQQGRAMLALKQFVKAKETFANTVHLDPENGEARNHLDHACAVVCDWKSREENLPRLMEMIEEEGGEGRNTLAPPFSALSFLLTPEQQLATTRLWSAQISKKTEAHREAFATRRAEKRQGRLRVGYLSYNFRDHATSHLIQGLFELHDRTEFEVFAYSMGPDDRSEYRKRIARDSDHFIDIAELTNAESGERIYDDAIDILIDLMGYCADCRPEIVAQRPAPVQVSYFYPATMGGDFIDYLVTDRVVNPPETEHYYHEKLVRMPHSYFVNDHRQPISEGRLSRADCALPDDGFVFCCFNGNQKIDHEIFEVWMGILSEVPNSVLWLYRSTTGPEANLRKEAEKRGVESHRIVFADSLPKPQHLARHRLAGLFLDTLVYNAHTTASDALWTGLPLITLPGETFACRVAASLLTAVGMPELIMPDLETYEKTAIRLATNPGELQGIRDKLAKNRTTTPLFDTPRWTRNWEKALKIIWERYERGEEPGHLEVEE